ncbi:hypothetical protein AMJ85_02765 [candidate division BRC1 bacterium SM23_51]|nr:MAG: hypothetical protein AMJ85_02765 [candidate division BRC1 bacterium SM23_51]
MGKRDSSKLKSLVEHALDASTADATVVHVRRFLEGATRYANSRITQNIVRADTTVEVEVAFGSQVGQCTTNRLDKDSIAACIRRAETIARVAPADPEYMPPVKPAPCPPVATWCPETAVFSPAKRAEAIVRAVAIAEREGMTGAGVFVTRVGASAIGNSAGLFVDNEATEAVVTFSATTPDSVGWAQGRARDVGTLDVESVARRALEKARAGHSPRDLAPGRYEVVLEPAAAEELLSYLFWYQMDAKATDEERTYLTGKKGTRIAAPSVTIFSDSTHALCPTRPFTDEGMTLRRIDWMRNGVLENLVYSRFWAKKQGVAPTGMPTNLIMAGGETPLEEMIRLTRRGLLVTRFWYIRAVEPIRDLYTGMTRDGTFLIEDGKIVAPVKNLRFNESAVHLLENVEMLGRQELVGEGRWSLMPYVKARDFNFTSTTRF